MNRVAHAEKGYISRQALYYLILSTDLSGNGR